MTFVTIDFEATCLPRHGRSFPIEVGIADESGARSWLIKPAAGWDWTQEASHLHGIDPERLERDGLPPHRVFAELCQAIAGRRIVADSPVDNYWWSLLAGAAGEEATGRVDPVGLFFDELGVTSDAILKAQGHADRHCPGRHRAGDDARWLWVLLSELGRTADHAGHRIAAPWMTSVAA